MDSTYISDPYIAGQHWGELLFGATDSYPDPWKVYNPTPEGVDGKTGEIINEAEYDEWLEEMVHEMEDEDAEGPEDDLDHRIHRPDDDFADLNPAHDAYYEALDEDDDEDEEDEVPACGGCSGCCECLGDPPLEWMYERALARAQTKCNCGWADCTYCGE